MKKYLPLALIGILALTACRTLVDNTVAWAGAIDIAVNVAMQVWHRYESAGRATPEQITKINHAYDVYQKARKVMQEALIGYKQHPDGTQLQMALDALNYAGIAIGDLIVSIIPAHDIAVSNFLDAGWCIVPVERGKGATSTQEWRVTIKLQHRANRK